MTEKNPAIFLQSGSHPAEDVRRWIGATAYAEGVVSSGDLKVSEKAGTPNMSVDIAGGRAYIHGDEGTYQGTYFVENRASTNVVIPAANGTNPRKDLIVARVRDSAYSGATNAWALEVVQGTAAASPAEPAVPNNAIVLALVDVPANDTAITNSQITDRRAYGGRPWAAPWGKVAVVSGTAQSGITTSPTDLTGLTVSYSGAAGRLLLLQAVVPCFNTTGNSSLYFYDSSTAIAENQFLLPNTSNVFTQQFTTTFVTTSTTHTLKVRAAATTGSLSTYNTGNYRIQFIVTDLGPDTVG